MKKFLLLATSVLLCSTGLSAQNTSDIVVPVTVTTTNNPASITLDYPATANAVNTLIGRKLINQTTWNFIVLGANSTTFTDNNVLPGIGYEYIVIKQASVAPTTRVGLVYAGIELPARAYRGKMLLIVDDALSAPLADELDRLEWDLRGDGWQVLRQDITVATSTVASVKSVLTDLYNDDPDNTVTALLFGDIPVPYSGDIAPDGHPDHQGAWPTDYYYGDMDEDAWTDTLVNNPGASRAANRNIPGDGKFDQSQTPTLPEMVVSRVDFSNLSGWDVSNVELYRRYLNKNHAFRTGAYKPDNQTLIDDNFGYFGGEAFAQNGWRNAYALTGANSAVPGDFFGDTDNKSFLIGYGCGGGNYQGAAGVGTSANFSTDSVNVVFAQLFGSYFGDWDFETNPFMPSALASKGGILTCSWAGRPNWSLHHMGLGEPILTSTFWVWLNSFLPNPVYPPNFGDDLIHVGLLGDPSIRAHAMQPPADLIAQASCNDISLVWKASPDADLGYLVYRAPSPDSVFQVIVNSPVLGNTYMDTMPLAGSNYYMVKAFRLENTPTGSFYNQSGGAHTNVDFNASALTVTANPTDISCFGAADGAIDLTLSSGGMNLTYLWSNGETGSSLTGLTAGTYTVTVTGMLGCTATDSATVAEPDAIGLTPTPADASCFGAADGSIDLAVSGGTPGYAYAWSNGSTTQNQNGLTAGTYTVTVTDLNNCTESAMATITEPDALALALTPENVACNGASTGGVMLTVSGGTPGYAYAWSDGSTSQNLSNVAAGTYTVTVTDDNNCTSSEAAMVTEPTAITTNTVVTNAGCAGATDGSIELTVDGGTPGYTYQWSNGATTQNLVNVAAGDYTVTITDSNSCTQTTAATVGQATSLVVSVLADPVSCFGAADGEATATVGGGTPGYTYLWSNNATTEMITGLTAGLYTVTVTDEAGCSQTSQTTVSQPAAVNAALVVDNVACNGETNGQIDLTVSGGTPPYAFAWSNGSADEDIDALAAGTYTATITDVNGCTYSSSATVTEPAALVVDTRFEVTSCPDETPVGNLSITVSGGTPIYTYLWSNGSNSPEPQGVPYGTYTVTVTDANGCVSVHENIVVQTPQPWSVNTTATDALCAGNANGSIDLTVNGSYGPNYTYAWSNGGTTQNLTDLTAGTYTVIVTDESGCTTTTDAVVGQPDALVAAFVNVSAASCPGAGDGAAEVAVTGGTTPYSYLWQNGATSAAVQNLPAGTAQVMITDANNCMLSETVAIEEPVPPVVSIAGMDTACVNLTALFSLPDTLGNFEWAASAGGQISAGQSTAQVEVVWPNAGTSTLTAYYTYGAGCQDSAQTTVVVDICVGTKEPVLTGVSVQPNPFGQSLTVLFDRPVQPDARLQLWNVQGRLVLEQTALTDWTELETGALPAGAYILQVVESGHIGTWKLIKVD
ncbi:MAG: T9SS type A sorting domain-containing protein [Bacteroidetes bacterium]|nr:MAG: T9SS type A sorting domain-containing protein [Bacteroidota bacterium]